MKPLNLNERRAIDTYRDKGFVCMKDSTIRYWKNKLHRQRRATERVLRNSVFANGGIDYDADADVWHQERTIH